MASVYELAQLSHNVYCAKTADPRLPVPGWSSSLGHHGNAKEGFYAEYFKNDKTHEVVIAYRGTDDVDDVWADAQLAVGVIPYQYPKALRMFQDVQKYMGGYSLYLTGHSLGGGLASLVAATQGFPAVTFNAPGMKNVLVGMMSNTSDVTLAASVSLDILMLATPGAVSLMTRQQLLSRQEAAKRIASIDTSKMWNIRASKDLVSVGTGPAIGRVASVTVTGWKPATAKTLPTTTNDLVVGSLFPGTLLVKPTLNEVSKAKTAVKNTVSFVGYQHSIKNLVECLKGLPQYKVNLGWLKKIPKHSMQTSSSKAAASLTAAKTQGTTASPHR